MEFIYYEKCSTCLKAKKWLDDNNVVYRERKLREFPPTYEELKLWNRSVDIKKMFNTSGLKYRELNLKDKLKEISLEESLNLLTSEVMLVKRPIFVVDEKNILFGFREKLLKEILRLED